MRKIKIMPLLVTALLAIGAFDSAFATKKWKNGTKIYGIQAQGGGGFIIYGKSGDDPACAENGKLFYVNVNQHGVNAEGVKTLLSVALTAFAAGKEVSFLYDDATQFCYVNTIYMN